MCKIMSLLCPNHTLSSFLSDNKIQSLSHGQHGPTWFYSQLPLRSKVSPLHSWITLFQPQWPLCHALIIPPPSISQFVFFLFSQSAMLYLHVSLCLVTHFKQVATKVRTYLGYPIEMSFRQAAYSLPFSLFFFIIIMVSLPFMCLCDYLLFVFFQGEPKLH